VNGDIINCRLRKDGMESGKNKVSTTRPDTRNTASKRALKSLRHAEFCTSVPKARRTGMREYLLGYPLDHRWRSPYAGGGCAEHAER
jgi:hypothetical protein